MRQSTNTYLDFDGTLVRENSSRLLVHALVRHASTPAEKALVALMSSPVWRVIRLGALVGSRLFGERDFQLLLVLWAFRQTLKQDGEAIFANVANQLTLNPVLEHAYARTFSIASSGLRPVIDAFLELHPELPCVTVYASTVATGARGFKVRLLTLRAKVRMLQASRSTSYFTDYDKEAALFARMQPFACDMATLSDPEGKTIFQLTVQ